MRSFGRQLVPIRSALSAARAAWRRRDPLPMVSCNSRQAGRHYWRPGSGRPAHPLAPQLRYVGQRFKFGLKQFTTGRNEMLSRNSRASLILSSFDGVPLLAVIAACNPAVGDKPDLRVTDAATTAPASGESVGSQRSSSPSVPASPGLADASGVPAAPAPAAVPACSGARAEAEFVRQAIDIIVVLDNSGSMSD